MLVALAVGSCSNPDDDPPPTSATTTSSPKSEVEAAYLAYRKMVRRLLESPDPEDEDLAKRSTDENFDFLVEQLSSLDAAGRALRFGPDYRFDVSTVMVDGSTATVRDCTVDDAQTIEIGSGAVVSEGTTTQLLEAALVFESGRWRVSSIDRLGTWDGAVRCDEQP